MNDTQVPKKMQLPTLDEAKLFVKRVSQSDFLKIRATDQERQALAQENASLSDSRAQDFLAWRRAGLWVSATALAVTAIFLLVETIQVLSEDDMPGILLLVQIMIFLAGAGGTALVALAALRWTEVKRSRHHARLGWMLMFLTPFILALVPFRLLITVGPGIDPSAARIGVGFLLGVGLLVDMAPKMAGLFLGIIRSAMAMKTLLPQSPLPGWVAVLLAPLYALLLVVLIVVINQMAGNYLLVGGILACAAAPCVYVKRAKEILRPMTPPEAESLILGARRLSGGLAAIGTALIFIWVVENKALNLGVLDALKLVCGLIGQVVLILVVASDFFLALLITSHRMGQKNRGSEHEKELEARLVGLETAGLQVLEFSVKPPRP